MAAELLASAMEPRTFAGPYSYESQQPMKTFLGHMQAPPVMHVVKALESLQLGEASSQQKGAAKEALGLQHPPGSDAQRSLCMKSVSACFHLKDEQDRSNCVAQASERCLNVM